MTFFVYYLLDAAVGELLYIGRSHSPESRRQVFERRIGRPVVFGLFQRFSDFDKACRAELLAISKHWPPYNKYLTSSRGGRGLPKTHTQATKMKISMTKSGVPNEKLRGRQFSQETRAKMSAAKAGRSLSAETRARMSASRTGLKRGPYQKRPQP